jgi:hypothetical protein
MFQSHVGNLLEFPREDSRVLVRLSLQRFLSTVNCPKTLPESENVMDNDELSTVACSGTKHELMC